MIRLFNGSYKFLSNFYDPCSVHYDGLTYRNSEAAYQAQKCLHGEEKKLFTDLDPYKAKKYGRKVEIVPDWDEKKAEVMREIIHAKFEQHPELVERLIATGEQELVEGNNWHDNFFGACECPECRDLPAENWLGLILMDERYKRQMEANDEEGNGLRDV